MANNIFDNILKKSKPVGQDEVTVPKQSEDSSKQESVNKTISYDVAAFNKDYPKYNLINFKPDMINVLYKRYSNLFKKVPILSETAQPGNIYIGDKRPDVNMLQFGQKTNNEMKLGFAKEERKEETEIDESTI